MLIVHVKYDTQTRSARKVSEVDSPRGKTHKWLSILHHLAYTAPSYAQI